MNIVITIPNKYVSFYLLASSKNKIETGLCLLY